MNCKPWSENISEWIDGTLSRDREEALRSHLRDCAACQSLERDLRQIASGCRQIKPVPAGAEQWSALRRRLQADGLITALPFPVSVNRSALLEGLERQLLFYRRLAYGALAACLVLVGVGIGAYWRADRTGQADAALLARQMEVQLTVMQLQKAITHVALALEKSKAEWHPEEWAVVEANLAALDKAISESHRLVQKNPADEDAGNFLIQACQKKLAVLKSVLNVNGI